MGKGNGLMCNEELGMRNVEYLKGIYLWVFLFIFLVFKPVLLPADDEEGIKTSSELELQISTMPEVKIRFSQSFVFPFLQGNGPLTRDNNIAAVLAAEVTPISVTGIGEITWTPAAFFLLSGGGQIGSGWDIPLGSGIGLNLPADNDSSENPHLSKIDSKAFDGLVWQTWGAGTFQFDLGAVIPGDWTHVLFQTRQEFRYAAYTRAASGDLWVFENDDGENQNGWNYYANYVLGYKMPLSPVLDTIAFMAEVDKSLYHGPGGDSWGEGLGRWIFSGIMNFSIHPRFSTAFILQMRTRRNFGTKNVLNNDYYYRDLELENGDGRRHILFYRAAFILTYKIS